MYSYFLIDVFVANPKYKNEKLIIKFNISRNGLIRFGEKLRDINEDNYFKEYHIDSSYRNINTTLGFSLKNNYNDFIIIISDKNNVVKSNNILYEKKMIRKSKKNYIKDSDDKSDALIQVFLKNENITNSVGDIVFKVSIDSANLLGETILNAIKMGHSKFAIPCINNKSHLDYISDICTEKNKLIFISIAWWW